MVAGPNGSGKTTLTRLLRERGVDLGQYVNPDDIALELQGSYEARVAEAQRIADARRNQFIMARRSFSFETVMSHPSKIDVLIQANAAGFFTGCSLLELTIQRRMSIVSRCALPMVGTAFPKIASSHAGIGQWAY
jgi:predicted ABC-type ATPase